MYRKQFDISLQRGQHVRSSRSFRRFLFRSINTFTDYCLRRRPNELQTSNCSNFKPDPRSEREAHRCRPQTSKVCLSDPRLGGVSKSTRSSRVSSGNLFQTQRRQFSHNWLPSVRASRGDISRPLDETIDFIGDARCLKIFNFLEQEWILPFKKGGDESPTRPILFRR